MRHRSFGLIFPVVAAAILSQSAYGYLDPGTFSVVGQVLAAFFTWVVLGFVFFKNFFVGLFNKFRKTPPSSPSGTLSTEQPASHKQAS
ncbi:MAG: hypothetical protein HYR96_02460 [Deltaproteobacteria bacterium]|nr:hypothetical protein [Deltaproteobacteria bacterium]MBI3295889.1 hypothetical protein [Deltaproteobacteria bacterium]